MNVVPSTETSSGTATARLRQRPQRRQRHRHVLHVDGVRQVAAHQHGLGRVLSGRLDLCAKVDVRVIQRMARRRGRITNPGEAGAVIAVQVGQGRPAAPPPAARAPGPADAGPPCSQCRDCPEPPTHSRARRARTPPTVASARAGTPDSAAPVANASKPSTSGAPLGRGRQRAFGELVNAQPMPARARPQVERDTAPQL